MPNMHINTFPEKLEPYKDAMNQVQVPIDHICVHPRGSKGQSMKWSKYGSYLDNSNVWGHFWSKYGYLTPCGRHTERYFLLFGDSF